LTIQSQNGILHCDCPFTRIQELKKLLTEIHFSLHTTKKIVWISGNGNNGSDDDDEASFLDGWAADLVRRGARVVQVSIFIPLLIIMGLAKLYFFHFFRKNRFCVLGQIVYLCPPLSLSLRKKSTDAHAHKYKFQLGPIQIISDTLKGG